MVTWQGSTPFSSEFDDIYFNPEDGLAEARHVFLDGNCLNDRFARGDHFTIAELGFGSGLNLLAAWQRFIACAPANAVLHYVTFERYPLAPDEMMRAASHWPELMPLAKLLFPRLSWYGEGIYRLHGQQLVLTVVIGDAATWLPQMEFAADAWFLDGFAPAKNPAMWSDELLHQVARHTRAGGTAATFTAAGAVKRALMAGGFEVQKIKGYGRKREMIVATLSGACEPALPPRRVRVIGGGIAGCAVAYSLAQRSIAVDVYEANALASGASGNVAGALYPALHKQLSPVTQGYWDGLRYSRALLPLLAGVSYAPCGMIKLPIDEEDARLLAALPERVGLPPEAMCWLDSDCASEVAGVPLASGGLHLPQSAWVHVPSLCQALVNHPLISVHVHSAIAPDEDAVPTVLANGVAAKAWMPALPLQVNRGQVSVVSREDCMVRPQAILSHKGYAIALPEGDWLIGATYGRGDADCALRESDHAENLRLHKQYLPNTVANDAKIIGGRASLRTVTPDRMPLVGQISGHRYLSTGHGSRGLISAPIAGEWLADLITGTPLPLMRDSMAAWNVGRLKITL